MRSMIHSIRTRREALLLGAAVALTGLASGAQQETPSQLNLKPGAQPGSGQKSTGVQPIRYEQDASGRDASHPVWDPFKVLTASTQGALFAFENTALVTPESLGQDGVPEHLQHRQDELFFLLEGEVTIEIARVRHILRPGDCILGPRGVPHAFTFSALGHHRMLIAYSPAGQMEDFFLVGDASPAKLRDPTFIEAHGMTITGPFLKLRRPA
jgi:mannose-6-phosphate isomerase-like protein (cupin superfamily)